LGLEPVLEWWIFAWLIYTSYNYKLIICLLSVIIIIYHNCTLS
jgi:hypothetical protein